MTRHRAHIDGLRAVAVLAIVAHHINPGWLVGGYCGVDIFFVISGFVVTLASASLNAGNLARFSAAFYARRMLRIAPALIVCLLVTASVAVMVMPVTWLSSANARSALFAFFGASNLYLLKIDGDYFAPKAAFNPFTHTWSLGVEEQFYLLFPALIFLHARRPASRPVSWTLLGLVAVSLACATLLTRWWPEAAFYTLPPRLWELAAGVMLFQTRDRWAPAIAAWPEHRRLLMAWVSAGSIAVGLIWTGAFPIPWALPAVAGTLGLLAVFDVERASGGIVARVVHHPALVRIGLLSYSLYLWHWPVLAVFRWTVGLDGGTSIAAALALIAALTWASYTYVEMPLRTSPVLRGLPRRTVIVGALAALTAGAGLSQAVFALQPWLSWSVTRNTAEWYPTPLETPELRGCAARASDERVEGGLLTILSPNGCRSMAITGRLFVAGDSHAEAYARMLQMWATRSGTEVWLYTKPGCSVFNLIHPNAEAPPACVRHSRALHDRLAARLEPGDTLFLPSLRVPRFVDADGLPGAPEDGAARRRSVKEAVAEAQPLVARGVRVVVEAPKPIFKVGAFRCSDWFNRRNPACAPGPTEPAVALQSRRQPALDAIAALVAEVPAVEVWDPFPVLCPGTICSSMREGHPLFFDGDHLSGFGNLALVDSFAATMATRR